MNSSRQISIDPHDVHVWFVCDDDIHDDNLLACYHEMLNEQERAQQKRFVFNRHKHQYLMTRVMIRVVMSLYVNAVAPSEWRFKKNKYNKPYIDNYLSPIELRFNISHTDHMIVIAVTRHSEVGVDVEYLYRKNRTVDIAKAYFSATEFTQLQLLDENERHRRFYDLWTLKEAYIKACGMGLSIPLDQFSYHFPAPEKIQIAFDPVRDDHPSHWKFWQIKPSTSHIVSLAIQKHQLGSSYWLHMRKIVPLVEIQTVDYPVVAESD